MNTSTDDYILMLYMRRPWHAHMLVAALARVEASCMPLLDNARFPKVPLRV